MVAGSKGFELTAGLGVWYAQKQGNKASSSTWRGFCPSLAPFRNHSGALLNAPQNQGPTFAPNIPYNSLGWELGVGADWKLLEGLTLRMRGAYWKVGDWFKFACIDKAVANTWNGPLALVVPVAGDGAAIGSGWGIKPR